MDYTALFFQTVFCATSATIVSGAMAERTNFKAYCIYSAAISLFIYPIAGRWVWGGGWLSELGFHDFAGSAIVHMLGGTLSFVGAAILGPRIGKYTKDGKVNVIPGHNILIGALGVLILWVGWFGFNPASTGGLSDGGVQVAAKVFITTNLAACAAAITTMFFTWIRYGKPDMPEEDVKLAAQIAQSDDFIEAKPEGYKAPISQGGNNVSGGQKQRLSIARAIAKKPEILIFDDSFSALDFKTDSKLRKALKEKTKDITTIIVAQRISTILNADQIIVLDDGNMAGIGTHKELMKNCEVYRQIAMSQLSEEELA